MRVETARPLILASGSPRRRELLGALGLSFEVVVSDTPEPLDPSLSPESQALALAARKSRAVAAGAPGALVLGADTIVVLNGEMLGKPRDDDDAFRMLRGLSGHDHQVITGVALVDVGSSIEVASAASTTVRFRRLSDDDIARYVASGEPRDKAGGYAIQGLGATLIAGFDGCFTNVVGLPLCETSRLLEAAGLPLSASEPACRRPDGSPCPRLV